MRLHEEYIRRHNLNVPVICYDKRSCVFLRSREPTYEWNVLNITWYHIDQAHPGLWQTELSEPIHNSYGKSCFALAIPSARVFWDEYYDEILRIARYCKSRNMIVMPAAERTLSAWQMFLVIYDGWLADHMSADFFSLVAESTHPDLDTNSRSIAFRKAYKLLTIRSSSVSGFLEDNIMPLVRGHATWLENLING